VKFINPETALLDVFKISKNQGVFKIGTFFTKKKKEPRWFSELAPKTKTDGSQKKVKTT
jgi:hypothetical protein